MSKKNRQSGQALLIVIFAITLGLVALVSVSTRIVTSTRRVFIDNAYYKAQAVAEAGAEKFLLKSNLDLQDLVDRGTCAPNAVYTTNGFADPVSANCTFDTTEARAVVAVEVSSSGGDAATPYEVTSLANSAVSINLMGATSGNNVKVCWQGTSSSIPAYAEILSFYYSKNGSTYKLNQQKHECSRYVSWYVPPAGYSASDGVEDMTVSGDYSCFDIKMADTPQLLNLMSLVNGSSYQITFDGNVPTQGYKITSVGEVKSGAVGGGSLAGAIATRKRVVVEKSSTPNLGPWFNFAVTSVSDKIVAE